MKTLSTILIIIVIIAVGFGSYWYFTKEEGGGGPLSSVSIGDFFPFGQAPEQETPVTPSEELPVEQNGTTTEPVSTGGIAMIPKLLKVSSWEQAGGTIFASSTETVIRYTDRQTGNVFEFNLDAPEKGKIRVTNTTVPKIYSVVWFEKGTSLLLNYTEPFINLPQTSYGVIVPGNASSTDGLLFKEVQTSYVGDSIDAIASPSLQKIAYIDSLGGGNALVVANKNGASAKNVTSFDTKEWTLHWPAESTIVAATKPSAKVPGFAYTVNTTSGALRKILGGMNGLTILPHSNVDYFAYSEIISSTPLLSVYTKSTNKKDATTLKTLSEKCAWAKEGKLYCGVPKSLPSGDYPDAWYMGKISFDDVLWSYDTETGLVRQVLDPKTLSGNVEMDMTDLQFDPEGKYLIFTNKKDSSLWLYTL